MRTCHLTHYDLDAVVSTIFAKKAFPEIEISKCGGYGKVGKNLKLLKETGCERLVVTDLNLTGPQMDDALEHFEEVHYFDHHIESENFIGMDHPSLHFNYSSKMSASAMLYLYWLEGGGLDGKGGSNKALSHLAMYTDVYDMWRVKDDKFGIGYQLNDLFWHYSFFGFEPKFKDGFPGFTEEEVRLLKIKKQARLDIIEESPQHWVNEESFVILLTNRDAINDVQFERDAVFYFILTHNGDGYSCSFRAKTEDPDVNINDVLKSTQKRFPDIMMNGGGHHKAGGAQFDPAMSVQQVINFIEDKIEPKLNKAKK